MQTELISLHHASYFPTALLRKTKKITRLEASMQVTPRVLYSLSVWRGCDFSVHDVSRRLSLTRNWISQQTRERCRVASSSFRHLQGKERRRTKYRVVSGLGNGWLKYFAIVHFWGSGTFWRWFSELSRNVFTKLCRRRVRRMSFEGQEQRGERERPFKGTTT